MPHLQHIPDILDCLAQLSNDEVPTPPALARQMLDLLPEHVWSEPGYRWFDPACKSGVLLREAAARLMVGLADWQPDPELRRHHIFTRMLHGIAITEMTGVISRRTLYCSRDASSEHSVVRFDTPDGHLPFVPASHTFARSGSCTVCGAPPDLERGAGRENYAYAFIHTDLPGELADMKFDVIVTNPPFQIGMTDANGDRVANVLPIYQKFVERALDSNPRYLVAVTPSRWFAGGKGLDGFRARMIADRRLRTLVDHPRVYDCFPGVKIRGGVSYFLWDRSHDGDCEVVTKVGDAEISRSVRDLRTGDGVLVRDNRASSIIEKCRTNEDLGYTVSTRDPFGQKITSNYRHAQDEPFSECVPLVYGSKIGYVQPEQLERHHEWVDQYKVLIPKASSGDTDQNEHGQIFDVVLGAPIALAPGSACTQTYLVAGVFGDQASGRVKAENYAHYLATKLVRFLVLQRKPTQNMTANQFRFVPMLPMDRRWTDEDLYEHFGLDDSERAYVEASIKPRSVNLSLDSCEPESHRVGGHKHRPSTSTDLAVMSSSLSATTPGTLDNEDDQTRTAVADAVVDAILDEGTVSLDDMEAGSEAVAA